MIPEQRAKSLLQTLGKEGAEKEVEKRIRLAEVIADPIGKAMDVWYWETVKKWLERLKDEGYVV